MNDRYSRQSFLGPDAERRFDDAIVGIVGLGGGGSHIVQQLAHLGFKNYVLFDHDRVEESNLNRLIGATSDDARSGTLKVDVATRLLRGLLDSPAIEIHPCRWQAAAEALRRCDLVFGCVDTFTERNQLENTCRRYLIPLIDIGLDVVRIDGEPPFMGGQVIVSMPDGPCMWCLGFLTEANLAREVAQYGDAGPRPQVVFANGVLASTAVAHAVDLLTAWSGSEDRPVYLEYRGNDLTLQPRRGLEFLPAICSHHPRHAVGAPVFREL